MNYEGNFRCWATVCKNKECAETLFLDVIGPAEKHRFAVLPPFASFKITCPDCRVEDFYSPSDVEEKNLNNPPMDYRCREFLDAIAAASKIHHP
jgi:hypothetical protein